MTSRSKTTDEELKELISGGNLKPETLRRQRSVLANFKQDLSDANVQLEDIKDDPKAMSKHISMYLNNIRVAKARTGPDKNVMIRPKTGYLAVTFSHLKSALREFCTFDFNNKNQFPELALAVSGIKRTLKREGRGNTKHTPHLPEDVLMAIYSLFANLQEVMEARTRKDRFLYEKAVQKLPSAYR